MDLGLILKWTEEKWKEQSLLIIGIDGCGGAGKSTLANKIKSNFSTVTIVHMDDFYLPSAKIVNEHPTNKLIGADFDWKRLLQEVLDPISNGIEGCYKRYDWETDSLAESHTISANGIVIIEGVYATRQELAGIYDLKIWVNCPRETRIKRGIARDGEAARDMWENNWMIAEDMYVESHKPHEFADVIIDGTNNEITNK
ncbi:AAA family ATPase [Bacillus cereus]|uniref:AAA family ATPase n=1 Tax=Bacillus thuringiensis TaxID=1428 RepID=A0A0B5NUE2_BACTU|nr:MULTISPECIES: AAA family ATPase [Bacillus]AJG77072.1 dephospho-CoA kinase family protein [Bacillus thuringiensis]AJH83371.1 dephospho-CoA kinase family protein [Bacillus thuringiensis]EEM77482.1 uridine kinase [Bacillus thuringiensis serovar pondicheriensis BGSC 4BA1]KAA0748990.1 uridine kinase [Bacillus sp. AY1-10]MCQ0955803.1 AAA family ATPase [Bacillus cereus]